MFSGKQSKEFMPDGFYFLYATEDDVIFWEQDSRNLWSHHDRDLGESRGSTQPLKKNQKTMKPFNLLMFSICKFKCEFLNDKMRF